MNYGTDICIQSVTGAQLRHSLSFINHEVQLLIRELELDSEEEDKFDRPESHCSKKSRVSETNSIHEKFKFENTNSSDCAVVIRKTSSKENFNNSQITNGIEAQLQPIHNYPIDELILDYRKLSLYGEQLNEICAYNFLAIHVVAYIQMICDVFVIFQLLRTPGSDPTDVAYFIEDCIVCK